MRAALATKSIEAAVATPVQYGPCAKSAVVHLTNHHMLPVARTGALLGDLYGLPMSDATVLAIQELHGVAVNAPNS